MKEYCTECNGRGKIWHDEICQTTNCESCEGVGVYDCDYNCDDEGLYEVNVDGADITCECPNHYRTNNNPKNGI